MPPKKAVDKKKKKGATMSLAAFQQSVPEEDTNNEGGSWGDRMTDDDDIAIPQAITTEELRESTGDTGFKGRYRPPRSYDDEPKSESTTTYEEYMKQPREKREPRPRQADNQPLPTERPFVVYVGNLPFSGINKDDIADFFGSDAIENIVLPVDREREGRIRGHGYVEFVDFESFKTALSKDNSEFNGRQIRVDVTDRETAERMSAGARRGGSGGFGDRRGGGDRFGAGGEERIKSISDDDGNWRGGGRTDVSIFGNKRDSNRGGGDRFGGSGGGFRERRDDREGGSGGFRPREDREGGSGGFRERRDDGGFRQQREERSAFGDKFSDRGGERRTSDNPFGGFNKRGGDDNRRDNNRRSDDPLDRDEPMERPKLNLKPRTVDDASPSASKQSDLFGGGKAWEETDNIRKKLDALELQQKKQHEEASQHLEEEKKKRQEEREKKQQQEREEPRSDSRSNNNKKTMDFASFGKNSRGGGSTSSGRGGGRTGAIPTDETGKKDYKKRYENKEKREETTEVKKDNKKDEKSTAGNKFGGFGVLGEEDLE